MVAVMVVAVRVVAVMTVMAVVTEALEVMNAARALLLAAAAAARPRNRLHAQLSNAWPRRGQPEMDREKCDFRK